MTWEIADEPMPTGVGTAIVHARRGPVGDAVGRGALVARALGALADGDAPAEPADVSDAPADGVPAAAGRPPDGLSADEPEDEAPVVADAARLAGGGVAWHAARRDAR